ncbi:hypothetical protein D3C73_1373590 [compost metagenome]
MFTPRGQLALHKAYSAVIGKAQLNGVLIAIGVSAFDLAQLAVLIFVQRGNGARTTIGTVDAHQHQRAVPLVIFTPQAHNALVGHITAGTKGRKI